MYIILQKSKGKFYCYFEYNEKHHVSAEQSRQKEGLKRLDNNSLTNDCCLDSYGEDFYFVFQKD
jgi:hypothetical protein